MESNERPWQKPPPWLAHEILMRLPLSDHIRFAVVCRQWRSVQRQLCSYRKPSSPPMLRLPWLIPSVRGDLSLTAALSPFEPKPQLYPFHSTTTANPLETLLGVSHGWLILFYVRIRLVNPISGDEIQIPSPYLQENPFTGFLSGFLSGSPTHPGGFTVMVRSSSRSLLWRRGQSRWTVLTVPPDFTEKQFNKSIRSVVSCGGKFYMDCFNDKRFFLVDPRRLAPAVEDLDCAVMPRDQHWADFLVDLDGRLLLVRAAVQTKRKVKDVRCVGGFEVYRAEKTWVKMKGLGDRALFISEKCSFSLVADAAGGIRDNYIYFPESILESVSSEERPLWKGYNLGTETMIEGSPCPAVTDRYDWSQFRSGLQWMMPEPGEKKNLVRRGDVRNIAIVAHVDHGKTTLVDSMLRQAKVFRDNQAAQERVMDSNDLERERGITILGKNTSITFKGTKINIINTPDFGVEVERVLNMVEGVLLVVDSEEGLMPHTRFVLKRTVEFGHEIVLVVNNIDKPSAQPDYVISDIFDLLSEFNASDEQCVIQVIFASGSKGKARKYSKSSDNLADDLGPLFEAILQCIPEPNIDKNGALQMLVTSTEYDEHKGRIAIGRLHTGILQRGMEVMVCTSEDTCRFGKIDKLFVYESFSRVPAESVEAGDICAVCGISDIMIGETIADKNTGKPLPAIKVGEPTVKILFSIKIAPFVGCREGNCVTSVNLRDRLYRELVRNLAINVENGETAGTFFVSGRGTLHITILIENMRREGYQFMVGPPKVINKWVDEMLLEPFETATVEVPEEYVGPVVELMEKRCGQRVDMQGMGSKGKTFIKYEIPTRGLLGLRNAILTASQGTAILNAMFDGYGPWAGDISTRDQGSLVSLEEGTTASYALFSAQERGQMFISPGMQVYKGQIVGIHKLPGDLSVNVCKEEAATNVRSNKEVTAVSDSPLTYSLDDCIEYIQDDELIVVTPLSIRMCKNPKTAKEKY